MQTTPKSIDFNKVEVLRRHMMLTATDMADIFQVSRQTYNNWLQGKPLRPTNEKHVKKTLRQLLAIVKGQNWPDETARNLDQRARVQRLLVLLRYSD